MSVGAKTNTVLTEPTGDAPERHVLDSPFESFAYPSLSADRVEQLRSALRQRASGELSRLLVDALARAEGPPKDALRKTHVRDGSPGLVVAKAVEKGETDLLTLGTHGSSGLAHRFLRTVAGDVLRNVTCDPLVAPPRPATTASS